MTDMDITPLVELRDSTPSLKGMSLKDGNDAAVRPIMELDLIIDDEVSPEKRWEIEKRASDALMMVCFHMLYGNQPYGEIRKRFNYACKKVFGR